MKTISIKILSMKKSEEILCELWEYITESLIVEFSIVDAADEDKQTYGAQTSLITINAITGTDDDDSVKSEFAAACAFLNEEYAGAFVVKEFTVNDSLFADKLRFNALVSQKERQRINAEVRHEKITDSSKEKLSEAENVLFRCNQKAIVLKTLNDYAARGEGFSYIADDDISALYGGMSAILTEIVEDVSNVMSLVGGLQNAEICKSLKEVQA